jgi:hypothetical protein
LRNGAAASVEDQNCSDSARTPSKHFVRCHRYSVGPLLELTDMKMVKAIRQQAATAERVAVNTADTYVADQMRTLAQAFKIQAEIIKKNKKKKKK